MDEVKTRSNNEGGLGKISLRTLPSSRFGSNKSKKNFREGQNVLIVLIIYLVSFHYILGVSSDGLRSELKFLTVKTVFTVVRLVHK